MFVTLLHHTPSCRPLSHSVIRLAADLQSFLQFGRFSARSSRINPRVSGRWAEAGVRDFLTLTSPRSRSQQIRAANDRNTGGEGALNTRNSRKKQTSGPTQAEGRWSNRRREEDGFYREDHEVQARERSGQPGWWRTTVTSSRKAAFSQIWYCFKAGQPWVGDVSVSHPSSVTCFPTSSLWLPQLPGSNDEVGSKQMMSQFLEFNGL